MYQVFQDGRPADNSPEGYPQLKYYAWKNSKFLLFSDAEFYANKWCYPGFYERGMECRRMEVGVPIDMGMGEAPVIMEIRESVTDAVKILQKRYKKTKQDPNEVKKDEEFHPDLATIQLDGWLNAKDGDWEAGPIPNPYSEEGYSESEENAFIVGASTYMDIVLNRNLRG